MLNPCLEYSRVLYFWEALESVHKFIIELHGPQWLYVKRSSKKRRVRITSNFTKGETFHLLWQPIALKGNLTMWPSAPPFLHPPKKPFFCSSVWPRREYTYGQLIERRVYWFVLKIVMMFPIPTSRNRMMNTFIIVNITHTYSLEEKSMLQKGLPSLSSSLFSSSLKEELSNLFSKLPGYSLFLHR